MSPGLLGSVVVGVPVVVALPNTPPPPPAAVPVPPCVTDPVHFAPMGQHAMLFELSFVQTEPEVQQAPP